MSIGKLILRVKAQAGPCKTASSCPSEISNYGPEVLLIWKIQELLLYQYAKAGHYGQGLPPVTLNFEDLKL